MGPRNGNCVVVSIKMTRVLVTIIFIIGRLSPQNVRLQVILLGTFSQVVDLCVNIMSVYLPPAKQNNYHGVGIMYEPSALMYQLLHTYSYTEQST